MRYLTQSIFEISVCPNKVCDICPLAKQTRLSFGLSSISTVEPFELIHCDIWGAFRVSSHSGAHYFLTIVDDFSRHTWIYLMRYKSETQAFLKSFFAFVETQFNKKVKRFRVENEGEFYSMKKNFSELRIMYETSCVSTPQQNGIAERKYHHILSVAKALRFQSYLPTAFWGESVLTVVYLINCLPTPLLSKKTPFEVLHRCPPTYNHLTVFGSLCFATNVQPKNKFDLRARKCIFVGYPMGQKAYKVYDLESKQIFTSRDVIFHEHFFPFQSIRENNENEIHVLPIPLSDQDIISEPLTSYKSSPQETHKYDNTTVEESIPSSVVPTNQPMLRRSDRIPRPSIWLRDFHCSQTTLLNPNSSSSSM